MDAAMLEQYPALPRGHSPVLPTNTQWTLYEDVTINSKGFALQPQYCSHNSFYYWTHFGQITSYATDMKGYIALS
eukprot:12409040-Karenia_brevis.AAC.1